jgi:hypothetical protein
VTPTAQCEKAPCRLLEGAGARRCSRHAVVAAAANPLRSASIRVTHTMSGPRLPRVGWALVLCGLLAASAAAQPSETALTESGIISDIVDAVSPTCSANITISFGGDQPVEVRLLCNRLAGLFLPSTPAHKLANSNCSKCKAGFDALLALQPPTPQDGELLAPPEAAAAPNVTIVSGGEALFTLLTLDPDAPDPANPTRRSILHYLVTNVPAGGAASEGTEVTPWGGGRPPSGTHRYVFLAYPPPEAPAPAARRRTLRAAHPALKPHARLHVVGVQDEPSGTGPTPPLCPHLLPTACCCSTEAQVADPVAAANNSRANFDARAFASQYGLGDPCGVAWFLAQP